MQSGNETSSFSFQVEKDMGVTLILLESKSASIRLQTSELVRRWPCWRLLSCRWHQRPQSKLRQLILSAAFDTVDYSASKLSRGPVWKKESHSRRAADFPYEEISEDHKGQWLILPDGFPCGVAIGPNWPQEELWEAMGYGPTGMRTASLSTSPAQQTLMARSRPYEPGV